MTDNLHSPIKQYLHDALERQHFSSRDSLRITGVAIPRCAPPGMDEPMLPKLLGMDIVYSPFLEPGTFFLVSKPLPFPRNVTPEQMDDEPESA